MFHSIKARIFSVLLLLAITALLPISSQAQDVGSDAPAFSGKDTKGNEIKLGDYKDKVVLLDFWASWCSPCKQEMPFLIELYNEYKVKNFEIIAINLDTQEKKMHQFIEQLSTSPDFKITFKVIWDPKAEIAEKYGLKAMPTTVLIDRKGVVRFRYKGFHPSKKEDYKSDLEELL